MASVWEYGGAKISNRYVGRRRWFGPCPGQVSVVEDRGGGGGVEDALRECSGGARARSLGLGLKPVGGDARV